MSLEISDSLTLDSENDNRTVQQWWDDYLKSVGDRVNQMVDDAVETLSYAHKNAREDIRNRQLEASLLNESKGKVSKKHVSCIKLTLKQSFEPSEVGKIFELHPDPNSVGQMCRIGRSSDSDFQLPHGVSIPYDCSVSSWHGKFTTFRGKLYYTDMSSNGSFINDERVPKDVPQLVESGYHLKIGEALFLIEIVLG